MTEKRKWSPQEIETFEKAWAYLKQVSPEIKARCTEFNGTNGRGLVTTFWAERLQWGTLLGIRPASGERRAQRIIDNMYGAKSGTGVSLAVNTLTDGEANIIGGLAAQIGNDFNLKIRREWERPGQELTELCYSIKPYFAQFK